MEKLLPSYSLPNDEEVAEFVNRAEEVCNKVRNILNGTDNESGNSTKMNDPKITENNENNGPPQTENDTSEGECYMYKEGVGDTGNYLYYCARCYVMYYYETSTCVRCKESVISREERIKELQEKVQQYKQEKEKRNKRRQKWEELKKEQYKEKNSKDTNGSSAKSALPNYDKWAYFEPDSDSDQDNKKNREMNSLPNEHESVYKESNKTVQRDMDANIESHKNVNEKSIPNIPTDECFKSAATKMSMTDLFKRTIDNDLKKRKESREAALQLKLKGNVFTQKKQYLKAIECYEKGLNLDNSCVELYTNLALCLIKTFQFEKAVQTCNTVLRYMETFSMCQPVNNATMFKTYSRKGLALFHLLRYKEALDCFNKSVLYDVKDETVRRYVYICYSYIENTNAIRYFVRRQKKEQMKQKYGCPILHPSIRPYRKYCCKSVIEYSKMTEEQVLDMKPEEFVAIERIATMCDNTEILLHFESDIIKSLTWEASDTSTVNCSVFVRTLMKMLCTYMNKINQAVHGDVLNNQNVDTDELLINYADMKIKAEHIIETLGSLAQRNPLYLDLFIECVRPVLTFYTLQFVNCHLAMFFLATVVRSVIISNEIRNLIKKCTTFWDVFFKMFDDVCADFSTFQVSEKLPVGASFMLELTRAADVKRNYSNYFLFLGKICLQHEVNDLLIHTYADNLRKLCKYINDRFQKNDGCVFYYMEILKNVYLGGGHMKEVIMKTCWDGIMHVLKTNKDKYTLLTVLNAMDILTYSWTLNLLAPKNKFAVSRLIEADVFENITDVWKKVGQGKSAHLIKILSSFFKYNCHIETEGLSTETKNNVNVVSNAEQKASHSSSGNMVNGSVNIPPASSMATNSSLSADSAMPTTSATYVKESTHALKTTDVTSSKGLTQTNMNAAISTAAMTQKTVAAVDVSTSNTCSNGSSTLERGADDCTSYIENEVPMMNNNISGFVDFRMVNILTPVLYEGFHSMNSYHVHKECAVVIALLAEYSIFFHCLNERKDFSIVNLIQRIVEVFNIHEHWFDKIKNYTMVCDITVFFNFVIRNIDILKNKKQEVIVSMRPLVVKLINMYNVVPYLPCKQGLLIMFSLSLIHNIYPDLNDTYNLREIVVRDGCQKSILSKTKT